MNNFIFKTFIYSYQYLGLLSSFQGPNGVVIITQVFDSCSCICIVLQLILSLFIYHLTNNLLFFFFCYEIVYNLPINCFIFLLKKSKNKFKVNRVRYYFAFWSQTGVTILPVQFLKKECSAINEVIYDIFRSMSLFSLILLLKFSFFAYTPVQRFVLEWPIGHFLEVNELSYTSQKLCVAYSCYN